MPLWRCNVYAVAAVADSNVAVEQASLIRRALTTSERAIECVARRRRARERSVNEFGVYSPRQVRLACRQCACLHSRMHLVLIYSILFLFGSVQTYSVRFGLARLGSVVSSAGRAAVQTRRRARASLGGAAAASQR